MKQKLLSKKIIFKKLKGASWFVQFEINQKLEFAKIIPSYSELFSNINKISSVKEMYLNKTFDVWNFNGQLYCKPL